MISIKDFCKKHGACEDGARWAIDNCTDMQDVWNKAKPDWLVWMATRKGILKRREHIMFACWCARQVVHLNLDPRVIAAIESAEEYTRTPSKANKKAAWEAAGAAREAAREAAGEAAGAAWEAALAAAWAAGEAAREAAMAAAGAAAWEAGETARKAQADYIRSNYKPRWSTK